MSSYIDKFLIEKFNDEEIIEFIIELSQIVMKNANYIKEIVEAIKDLTLNQKDIIDVLYKVDDEFAKVNDNIVNITKSNLFLNKIMDLMSNKIQKISNEKLLN